MQTPRQRTFRITPAVKREIVAIVDERIREAHVTREDFSELKAIVRELAEAQKRTEQRVEDLAEAQKRTEQRVEELAEAQKRTEQRVEELAEAQKRTEARVEELAEAQKRTEQRVEDLAEAQRASEARLTRLEQVVEELAKSQRELAEAQKASEARLTRLEQVVEELAEAQKKTEARVEELAEAQRASETRLTRLEQVVEELAEAQKKTEARVEELAEAQKRTEEEVRKLATGLVKLRGEVGGLARSFGYAFENEAYRMIPKTLKEKYGIELTERLIRTDIDDTEINILGLGVRDGREVVVVGEAKTRLEREEVFDELEEKVQVVKDRYSGREVVRVLVTHFAPKGMLRMAKERGIIVIQSFEWEV